MEKGEPDKEIEERWPHLTGPRKRLLFGSLCLYSLLAGYGPLLVGWGNTGWKGATLKTLGLIAISALLVWAAIPSITEWVRHG